MNDHVDQVLPVRPSGGVVFAVDDEENDRQLLARLIRDVAPECQCRLFGSGEELLDALMDVLRGARPPVACFVDIKMSPMSGFDVLRWIRAQRGLDAVPVIILSSSDDPQYLNEAHQFGAQCYAAKFPPAALVREMLDAARQYSACSGCNTAFPLPCNLLVSAHAH